MDRIQVENLVKIFGPNPQQALKRLKAGESKEDILKRTGSTVGVADLSFSVRAGEVFVVMGLSGSGKSTLIRCLNRLIQPTSGKILLDGKDLLAASAEELLEIRRTRMAMVFQHFGLFPHRTVLQNVAYGLEVRGSSRQEMDAKAREVIDLVGLSPYTDSYPDELSGGMQQRVGLARALATDPDVLLMDEAFSALDPLIRREMQDELLALQERLQKTIVFITHDLSEALKIGDRIAVMRDGKIVQIGTPEKILKQPADDYVASFTQDVDASRVFTAETVMKKPETVVTSKAGPRVALRKMRELGLSSVFVVGPSGHLEGLVTVDDVISAVKADEDSLEPYLNDDFPKTTPDTLLRDLIPVAVASKTPIAVTGDDGRLLGIIARVSVLAGLTREVEP